MGPSREWTSQRRLNALSSSCRLIGAEPCPSLLLQRHMAELLSLDKDMAASFLNSVLNQLNWAFSEFIGMIQEVSRAESGDLRV